MQFFKKIINKLVIIKREGYNKSMTKNKKILIFVIIFITLIIAGYFTYSIYKKSDNYLVAQTESFKNLENDAFVLNALNGTIKSINGNKILVTAKVLTAERTSIGINNTYTENEYSLNISTSTKIYINEIKPNGNYLSDISIREIKSGYKFDALIKENVLTNKILDLIELTIIK